MFLLHFGILFLIINGTFGNSNVSSFDLDSMEETIENMEKKVNKIYNVVKQIKACQICVPDQVNDEANMGMLWNFDRDDKWI